MEDQSPALVAMTDFKLYHSLEWFYRANPIRQSSGESDYGVFWQLGGKRWPNWRVSYIEKTGEVYAVCLGGNRRNQVIVLGVVPPDPPPIYYQTLDKLLSRWWAQTSLEWVAHRLHHRHHDTTVELLHKLPELNELQS